MSDIIMHGYFKSKNENNNYDTLYPENDTEDVLIGNELKDINIIDNKININNASTLLKVIINRLNTRSVYNKLLNSKNTILDNLIPLYGQAIIDEETGLMKMGDGKTKYKDLKYIKHIKIEE